MCIFVYTVHAYTHIYIYLYIFMVTSIYIYIYMCKTYPYIFSSRIHLNHPGIARNHNQSGDQAFQIMWKTQ